MLRIFGLAIAAAVAGGMCEATALTVAWARAAASRSSRCRPSGEADRLRTEIALLKEELA